MVFKRPLLLLLQAWRQIAASPAAGARQHPRAAPGCAARGDNTLNIPLPYEETIFSRITGTDFHRLCYQCDTYLSVSVMCAYICILFCVYARIHFLAAIPAASPLGTERKFGDYSVIFSSTDIMWIATLFGLERWQGNV